MKQYNTFLNILIIILVISCIGVGGYGLYYWYTSYKADKKAAGLISQFSDEIVVEDDITTDEPIDSEEPTEEEIIQEQPNSNSGQNGGTNKPSGGSSAYGIGTYYKGYKVIGIIEIPKLGIKYPIFDVDNTATLNVGTAAIYPSNMESALNNPGNVVIAGHNFRNSRMFSKLHTLVEGDLIYITSNTGLRLEYRVYNNYTANADDFSYATRNTSGGVEISLTTCTNNAATRTIIWAKA